MKTVKTTFFLACFLLVAFAGPASESRAQTGHTKGRALLVGISQYQQHPAVKPTRGAQEDAEETAKLIKTQYGFLDSEIKTLLGPQATAANIKAEFQHWLIEGTRPGDRVFFLYAGHGSQMKDEPNGDEADGLDEVLAPYDVNWRGDSFVNVIVDDELDVLIRQLSGRLAVLVFDSCNSGTISRGTPGTGEKPAIDGDARYLPSPEEAKKFGIGIASRGGGKPAEYAVSDERILTTKSGAPVAQQERDLKLVDIKADDTATGIVIISAAQSTQSAYSMDVDGKQRGALSYVFGEAQRGRQLRLGELRQNIEHRIAELQQSGRLRGKQKPAFEIRASIPLEDKPLFAGQLSLPEVAFANPQSALKVTLRSLERKQTYKIGDDISYEVTTSTPGWLYVLVFSQQQVATCIFPNKKERDGRFPKGTYRLPSQDFFQAQEPAGKDVVIALLSSVPLNLGDKEDMTWEEVFDRLRSRKLAGYVKTRGIGTKNNVSTSGASTLETADWQAASLVVETIP